MMSEPNMQHVRTGRTTVLGYAKGLIKYFSPGQTSILCNAHVHYKEPKGQRRYLLNGQIDHRLCLLPFLPLPLPLLFFPVGALEGDAVGFEVGDELGLDVGDADGFEVGDEVGFEVGDEVGYAPWTQTMSSAGSVWCKVVVMVVLVKTWLINP